MKKNLYKISFWIMIICWILLYIIPSIFPRLVYILLIIVLLASTLATIILSIVNLKREKKSAITSLIISSIVVIIFVAGLAVLEQPEYGIKMVGEINLNQYTSELCKNDVTIIINDNPSLEEFSAASMISDKLEERCSGVIVDMGYSDNIPENMDSITFKCFEEECDNYEKNGLILFRNHNGYKVITLVGRTEFDILEVTSSFIELIE